MSTDLTEAQRQVLVYIMECVIRDQRTPTHRSIQNFFGWSSPSSTARHLAPLATKGYIKISEGSVKVLLDPDGNEASLHWAP